MKLISKILFHLLFNFTLSLTQFILVIGGITLYIFYFDYFYLNEIVLVVFPFILVFDFIVSIWYFYKSILHILFITNKYFRNDLHYRSSIQNVRDYEISLFIIVFIFCFPQALVILTQLWNKNSIFYTNFLFKLYIICKIPYTFGITIFGICIMTIILISTLLYCFCYICYQKRNQKKRRIKPYDTI